MGYQVALYYLQNISQQLYKRQPQRPQLHVRRPRNQQQKQQPRDLQLSHRPQKLRVQPRKHQMCKYISGLKYANISFDI